MDTNQFFTEVLAELGKTLLLDALRSLVTVARARRSGHRTISRRVARPSVVTRRDQRKPRG